MNILIDAHMLGEQEGGNESYIAGLLQGLNVLAPAQPENFIALYQHHTPSIDTNHDIMWAQFAEGNSFRRLLVELPRQCRLHDAALLHVTYNAPLTVRCPFVVTVHDVIFRRFPQYFSPRVRLLLNTVLPLSMRRARHILTISEASKREIIHYYPFTAEKISVIPLAAGPLIASEPDHVAAAELTGGSDFLLAVGNVQPRKNLVRLMEAYIAFRDRSASRAKLIVVGKSQWQGSRIQELLKASPYEHDVLFTGYLPDSTVAALYQQCTAFVYPSLYEGFGIPVLEAMHFGAPVITSNLSSLPEVAGNAAILIDPHSVKEMAEALEAVTLQKSLRTTLQAKSVQQASRFSWEKVATETLDTYRQITHPGQ